MTWHGISSRSIPPPPPASRWRGEEFAPVIEPIPARIYHVAEQKPPPIIFPIFYYRADHQRFCPQVPEWDKWLMQTGNVGYVDGPFASWRARE